MTVFVTGSLHLDVVVQAPHLPALDETVTGQAVDYVFGGKGGNQAVAAARMGAKVSFAGRAGSDAFGDVLRKTLIKEDINIDNLQQDDGPSGMSTAIVDQNGDYGAVIVSAANLAIDPKAISIPDDVKIVLLQNEIPEVVNLDIAQRARAQGAEVWLNAAPARQVSNELLENVDLLIVNRVEAAFYTELPEPLCVLKTLGEKGVEFAQKMYPAFDIKPVSTHGAGDMFVGALAAAVSNADDMPDAIRFAQAAAALHVSSDLAMRETLNPERVLAFQTD